MLVEMAMALPFAERSPGAKIEGRETRWLVFAISTLRRYDLQSNAVKQRKERGNYEIVKWVSLFFSFT